MRRSIYFIFFVFLLETFGSCSFNKMFLQPDKGPELNTKQLFALKPDSAFIVINRENFQPSFIDKNGNALDLQYTVESVVFESEGRQLNGWFLSPKGEKNGFTLLHFHGNAGSVLGQFQFMTPLVKKGFHAFVFDYSGFGYSEGKAKRKFLPADGKAALDYVKSRPELKGQKLYIYGQSLGGHLAAVVGSNRQEDIDGMIIEGAFSSHQDIGATVAGFLARIFIREQYSAKKSIRNFKKPLLVIHSTEDETIPFKQGQRIYENANTPKAFYEIKGAHIYAPILYTDSLVLRIKALGIQ